MVLHVLKVRRAVRRVTSIVMLTTALLYISSFGALHAAGRVFYVATSGSDSAAGTQAQPFRTVNRGVSALTAGDTLLIQPGTYAEALINAVPGGTSSAPVVVKAADPTNRPILRPSSNTGNVLYIQNADKQYIIFDGIVFDGANVSTDCAKITWYATHITMMNSECKNAGGNGILITDFSDDHTFMNVSVHDNGRLAGHGIYISTKRNIIDKCEIYLNAQWGIHIYDGAYAPPSHSADANQVLNSHVHHNGGISYSGGSASGTLRGAGILLSSGVGNQASNNLVHDNFDAGIQVGIQYQTTSTSILNNTVYRNGTNSRARDSGWSQGIAVGVGGPSSGAVVRNNISYLNGIDTIVNSGSSTTLSNNLEGTNPMFVNPSAEDFHLSSASPAIDAGTTITAVTGDISGMPRPQGTKYDVGAYEFSGGGPAVAAPRSPANIRIIR